MNAIPYTTPAYPRAFSEIRDSRSESHCVIIQRHNLSGRHHVLAILKEAAGIRQLAGWGGHEEPALHNILDKCRQSGAFSTRPFRLGQTIDATTYSCVLALYAHYCRSTRQDPSDLMLRSYPRTENAADWTDALWVDITRRAQWEQTYFPTVWLSEDVGELLRAVRLIGRNMLADVLEQSWSGGVPSPQALSVPAYTLNPDFRL